MIVDCDRIWSQLVTVAYRLRRRPRVVIEPPDRPAGLPVSAGGKP